MNLNLSINKPEAEEADGDVNETKDEVDHCWGGDDDNEGEGDIENKYSKDAACFFWGERASVHAVDVDVDDDDDDDCDDDDNENG